MARGHVWLGWGLGTTLAVSLALVSLVGCGGSAATSTTPEPGAPATAQAEAQPAAGAVTAVSNTARQPTKPADPTVVLHTTQGDIKLRLFAQQAPRTVENFLENYANRGFYEKTIFHHVESGVMLIGGGYTAELEAKPTRTPIFNESRNGLSNRRGTIAMIREPDSPHSATSQFFINLADNPNFDFRDGDEEDPLGYCVFGEVIEGMDLVDRIAKQPTASQAEFAKIPSPPVAIVGVERL